ncbi:hypothetical protein QOZ80_2AG0114010 [Eleusine coracana subsp. coracana]|nr:hypothetical protein QOZ80_2AG0114010 [Eleusine coracana subsp. coracana]
MKDWSSLERGVLRDVFSRLPADADVVSFRHVCHNWRLAGGAGAPVPRPWFVFSRPSAADGTRIFVRPAQRHGRRSRMKVVHTEDIGIKEEWAHTRGMSRGWLAVSEEGNRLLLRDPISHVDVPLPAIDPVWQLCSIFLSDDPLVAPGEEFKTFAFFQSTDGTDSGHLLAFCRSRDAEWTRINPDDGQPDLLWYYRGLEFLQGRAYVLLNDYRVALCDVDARRLVVSAVELEYPGHDEMYSQECLVEAGGDLLFMQVKQRFVQTARSSPCCIGRSYDIRFFAKMIKIEIDADGMPVKWSDVQEIGDYAFFVSGQGHSFALPASGFPAVKAGCVYHFSAHVTMNFPEMIVSDLRQDPHRHEKVRKLKIPGPWRPLSWFCPRRPIFDTTTMKRK